MACAREQPHASLRSLQRKVAELEKAKAGHQRIRHDMGERVKELNCLYGLSRLVEKHGSSLSGIFAGLVRLIPPAWQYPEITCARLDFDRQMHSTENFRVTKWRQSADILVRGSARGKLQVGYLRKMPACAEGPFLSEERSLIDGICERLGKIVERTQAEQTLQSSELLLRRQKKALEQKNVALREVLLQIELEKKNIQDNIMANVETLLLPVLEKLKLQGVPAQYADLLEQNLKDITSSFGARVSSRKFSLTPREIEISDMIKSGLTSKEIASLLRISVQTVEKHRARIRVKLSISNTDSNLAAYLQTL